MIILSLLFFGMYESNKPAVNAVVVPTMVDTWVLLVKAELNLVAITSEKNDCQDILNTEKGQFINAIIAIKIVTLYLFKNGVNAARGYIIPKSKIR